MTTRHLLDIQEHLDRRQYEFSMIMSGDYRLSRRHAMADLTELLVKGFPLDDERLKNPPVKGLSVPDYFDEMLARIRDVRASERRMYLRMRKIFAMALITNRPGKTTAYEDKLADE